MNGIARTTPAKTPRLPEAAQLRQPRPVINRHIERKSSLVERISRTSHRKSREAQLGEPEQAGLHRSGASGACDTRVESSVSSGLDERACVRHEPGRECP